MSTRWQVRERTSPAATSSVPSSTASRPASLGSAPSGPPWPRSRCRRSRWRTKTRCCCRRWRRTSRPVVPPPAVPEWLLRQNREQLQEAGAEVERLEQELSVARISHADAAALEAAHAEVDDIEEKASRRFASPLAKRRLEAAREAEREILD